MSTGKFNFSCPNCQFDLNVDLILPTPPLIKMICPECYNPLYFDPQKNYAKIRREPIRKNAFLIHSAKKEDKPFVDWFSDILLLYGARSIKIEDDPRTERDWLQKSIDGIKSSEFVIAVLIKRYSFTDELGTFRYKAPDKCYDEIAMAFALGTIWGHKDMFALVEEGVDPGRVLEERAWCHTITMETQKVIIDIEFFKRLDEYLNS